MPVINKHILEKYLNGTCTPEEHKAVEEWYFQLGSHEPMAFDQEEFRDRELFQKIQGRMEKSLSPVEPLFRGRPKRNKRVVVMLTVFLILATGSFLYFTQGGTRVDPGTGRTVRLMLDNNSPSVTQQSLPDGSTVWLSPQATLEYTSSENSNARSVAFSGEAFFEVAKDSLHPFIIRTGDMETRVIGTSFNLLALPESKSFKVSVVTGKVQVSVKNEQGILQSILLLPSQQASFNLMSKELVYNDISERDLKIEYWKPFTLNFEDATMSEVKEELEKAFNVKIVFPNSSLSKCKIRVNFYNYKLPQVMDILEKILDVECKLGEDNILTIAGEGCN